MSKQKYLVVISGPTASGKTGLSLELAQYFDTVILSADSRQFYKELTIGTAKPTASELAKAKHYFIDTLNISQEYTVGNFEEEALALLEKLFQEQDIVLLVGGSGLFIQAVCQGFDSFPDIPKEVRQELNELYEKKGITFLQEELKKVDPNYFEEVDQQNPKRLIRALEVARVAGQPYSEFRKAQTKTRPFSPIYLQMNWPRETLYDRINRRVDLMVEGGLLAEVEALQQYESLNALQTVGYKEFFPYLRGEYDLKEAIELLKRNSRRYAKRQMTWNRRLPYWKHFHPEEIESIKSYLRWAMEGEQSLYWKKQKDQLEHFSLGVKSRDAQQEIVFGIQKKSKTSISIPSDIVLQPDEKVKHFLLHEIMQRNIDREIEWDLPSNWSKLLPKN